MTRKIRDYVGRLTEAWPPDGAACTAEAGCIAEADLDQIRHDCAGGVVEGTPDEVAASLMAYCQHMTVGRAAGRDEDTLWLEWTDKEVE